MSGTEKDMKLPSGRPPWDTWNGVRIGLLTGGIITILGVLLVGSNLFWLALGGAAVGGALGLLFERKKLAEYRRGADPGSQ